MGKGSPPMYVHIYTHCKFSWPISIVCHGRGYLDTEKAVYNRSDYTPHDLIALASLSTFTTPLF